MWPHRAKGRKRKVHPPPSTAGWIPQGGGRPRLWWVFGDFLPNQKVTLRSKRSKPWLASQLEVPLNMTEFHSHKIEKWK